MKTGRVFGMNCWFSIRTEPGQWFFSQCCIHLLRKPMRTDLLLCDTWQTSAQVHTLVSQSQTLTWKVRGVWSDSHIELVLMGPGTITDCKWVSAAVCLRVWLQCHLHGCLVNHCLVCNLNYLITYWVASFPGHRRNNLATSTSWNCIQMWHHGNFNMHSNSLVHFFQLWEWGFAARRSNCCCRFYYWSEIKVIRTKIIVQNAYTSMIK